MPRNQASNDVGNLKDSFELNAYENRKVLHTLSNKAILRC